MCWPIFSAKLKRFVSLPFPAEDMRGKLVGFVEHDQIPRSEAELFLELFVARHLVEPDNEVIVVREGIAAR